MKRNKVAPGKTHVSTEKVAQLVQRKSLPVLGHFVVDGAKFERRQSLLRAAAAAVTALLGVAAAPAAAEGLSRRVGAVARVVLLDSGLVVDLDLDRDVAGVDGALE